MDDEYGQMFGGEEYIEDDNFDDEIIDYDDDNTAGDLDLGSEEEVESVMYVFLFHIIPHRYCLSLDVFL